MVTRITSITMMPALSALTSHLYLWSARWKRRMLNIFATIAMVPTTKPIDEPIPDVIPTIGKTNGKITYVSKQRIPEIRIDWLKSRSG